MRLVRTKVGIAFRYGLLVTDLLIALASVALATNVADVHSASAAQLLVLAALLYVSGAYVQFRFENSHAFDFHDVLRLLSGAVA